MLLASLFAAVLLVAEPVVVDPPQWATRWPYRADSLDDWPELFFDEHQLRAFVENHDMDAWMPTLCDALVDPSTLVTRFPMISLTVGVARHPTAEDCLRRHFRYLFSGPISEDRVQAMHFALLALGLVATPTSLEALASMSNEDFWMNPEFMDVDVHADWRALPKDIVLRLSRVCVLGIGCSGSREGAELLNKLRADAMPALTVRRLRMLHNVCVATQELCMRPNGVRIQSPYGFVP